MDNEMKQKMLNITTLTLLEMLSKGITDPDKFIIWFKQYAKSSIKNVDENEIALMLVRPLWDFIKNEMTPNASYSFNGFEAMQDFIIDDHYYDMLEMITPNSEFTGKVIIHMTYIEDESND